MRAANVRLAQAIEAEHGYGPRVTEAIDETHEVMGTLQKETLQNLFAMRGVLNPAQADMFDKSVINAMTADARCAPTYRNVATRIWRPLRARTAKRSEAHTTALPSLMRKSHAFFCLTKQKHNTTP